MIVDRERRRRILCERRRYRGAKPAARPRLLCGAGQILSLDELEQGHAGLGVFVAETVDEADPEVEHGASELDRAPRRPHVALASTEDAAVAAPKASAVSIRAAACSLSNSTVSATLACG